VANAICTTQARVLGSFHDEALDHFARADAKAAELVKLWYFSDLISDEAAAGLDISPGPAQGVASALARTSAGVGTKAPGTGA
jgi:hypothetical protein